MRLEYKLTNGLPVPVDVAEEQRGWNPTIGSAVVYA